LYCFIIIFAKIQGAKKGVGIYLKRQNFKIEFLKKVSVKILLRRIKRVAKFYYCHIFFTYSGYCDWKKSTGLTTLNSAKDGIITVPFFLIQTEHYSAFRN
jgi:hypothetical protein